MARWIDEGARNDAIITATEDPSEPPSEPLFFIELSQPLPRRDDVARPGRVRLAVYDVLGRVVTAPVDGFMRPGDYRLPFDARCLPSGIYFYALDPRGRHDGDDDAGAVKTCLGV